MKLLYFAWLRQRIGKGEEDIAPAPPAQNVAELIDWLKARGPGYAAAFADPKLVRAAVNQVHVKFDAPIAAGDEVAFFPPVTGG
ncbi:MAG: molybdopterin converting factor subunit 1 [Alphaproteobacteria bacterium]|nr:molybdopterin converting factor subunit 1 [Alphaproteobacteria bacterium]